MIHFFRKIRRNLLVERQAFRYFKYAIGEIILVVIGILIALQLNNWNEQRKADDYEIKILKEINVTLVKDIKYFEILLVRLDSYNQPFENLISHIQSESFDNKSFAQAIANLINENSKIAYIYNSGPYNALKSSGIEKISNDELRKALILYYEFILPRVDKLLYKTSNNTIEQKQMDRLWELVEFKLTDKPKEKLLEAKSYNFDKQSHQSLLKLLYHSRMRVDHASFRLKSLVELTQNLNKQIQAEIDLRTET